jgi:hypothetical protein
MQPNPDSPFNVTEFLATANIIMAEDVNDPDKRCVVYEQKRYEELVASAVDGMVNVADLRLVFIELDADADDRRNRFRHSRHTTKESGSRAT